MGQSVIEAIRQVGDPLALALGLEILEIQSSGKLSKPLVRVILDKEGGVGIEDCEQFHQSLRQTWEVTHPNGPSCRFEISSPGLDRPLKVSKDFKRVLGEMLRITFRHGIDQTCQVVGQLVEVTEMGIHLQENSKVEAQSRFIEFEAIVKARLEVEF